MIVGIGIDLIEIERIQGVYARHHDRFLNRILTDAERAYVLRYKDPAQRLAGRWAAKEAAFKALGTGVAHGICWREAEILPDEQGKPCLTFSGKAFLRARELGSVRAHVTITHSNLLAMAQVILER